MSRATIRRLFTAQRSPPVTADDFLHEPPSHSHHSALCTSDLGWPHARRRCKFHLPGPMHCTGPPSNLLAAVLVTPLPLKQSPLPPVSPFLPASCLVLVLPCIFLQTRWRCRCPAHGPPRRLLPPVSPTSCLMLVLRQSCTRPCYHRHLFARSLSPLPLPPVSPPSHLRLALR